ncbi:MAG TPA: WG repeat-containing protein [Kofleriaceae bacterium]|nr:WG repeat-containing protein [Kofleriaceae bacterium]
MLPRTLALAAALLVLGPTAAAVRADDAGNPAPSPTRFRIHVKRAWGYIDATGKVVIPARYDDAGAFADGRTSVVKGKHVGVIDETGKVVVPLAFEWLGGLAQDRRAARVSDKECGYLDAAGAWAFHLDGCKGASLGDFADGLAAVVSDGKTRYVDPSGKVAFSIDGEGDGFESGVASVKVGDTRIAVDRTGAKLALPAGADEYVGGFWDGKLAPLMIGRACRGALCFGTWGVVDPSMKVVIAPQFRMAPQFAEGLAAAIVDFDPGYGYIDATGKVVIPYQFAQAEAFSEGRAWVADKAGRHALIDRTGAFIVPWRDDVQSTESFAHGLAAVKLTNGRYQVIDRSGAQVALFPAGAIPAEDQGDLVGYVTAAHKLVYLDHHGKTVWKEK